MAFPLFVDTYEHVAKHDKKYYGSFPATFTLVAGGGIVDLEEMFSGVRKLKRHLTLHRMFAGCVLGIEVAERDWDEHPYLLLDEVVDILEASDLAKISVVDMYTFIRGCMFHYLEAEFVCDKYHKLLQTPSETSLAQGLMSSCASFARKLPSIVYEKCTDAAAFCVKSVWTVLEDCFNKAFGSFCPHVYSVLGWVTKAFQSFKLWAEHIVESSFSWLCCARDSVVMGLALTSMTCLVALVERFLVATGLMTAALGLPAMFLTFAVGAICGYKALVSAASANENGYAAALVDMVKGSCMTLLNSLWPSLNVDIQNKMYDIKKVAKEEGRAKAIKRHQEKIGRSEPFSTEEHLQQQWEDFIHYRPSIFTDDPQNWVFRQKYWDNQNDNAQFSPINVLETVAASVSSWNSSTLVGVGRTCAAFSQIKNGVSALKDILAYICGKLYDCADSVFGLQSAILNDAAVLLGQDLPSWLKECDAMVDYMHLFAVAPRDVIDRMQKLLSLGRQMRSVFISSERRGSAQVLSLISKAIDKLETLYHGAILAGSNLPRKAPFFLFLTGESGVGKSSLTQRLTRDWLVHHELGQDCRYARNSQDPFWSGYRRQAVVTYDDFGAIVKEPSDESEIIPIVSRDPMSLNMASLEEKGMFFDSRLLVASSNFLAPSPNSQIHDNDAYARRRHLVVQVELKRGIPYNPNVPTENQRYIVRATKAPYTITETFETYEDLWTHFLNKFDEHEEGEQQFLKSLSIPSGNQSTAMQAIFAASTFMLAYAPGSIQAHITTQMKEMHYLAVRKGILYVWGANDELQRVDLKGIADAEDIRRAERDSFRSALQFEYVLRAFPDLNPLAVHYTMEIIKHGWLNEDLSVGNNCPDDYTRKLLESFPEWMRQYMFILSEAHLTAEKKPFFQDLLTDFKQQVCRLYATDFNRWNPILKIAFGCVLAIAVGGTVYSLFSSLWQCGTGAKFMVAATTTFAAGQSVPPNRQEVTEYKFRNVPFRSKHWSKGQACYGDSANWIMDKCMASLTYGSYVAQVCVLPGNQLVGVNHFLRVIPTNTTVKIQSGQGDYWVTWNKAKLVCSQDSELAIYRCPQVRQVPQSVLDRCIFDVERDLPKKFEATFLSYKYFLDSQQFVPEIAKIDVDVRSTSHSVMVGSYVRQIPRFMTYEANTIDGDCGSLIVAMKEGKACLVGLHISGVNGYGIAGFLPFVHQSSQGQFDPGMYSRVEEFEVSAPLGNGCYQVGFLKPEDRFRISTKSSLVETPLEWHLETPCEKIPSVITKNDPRLLGTEHVDFNPYYSGMEKYSQEAGPFDQDILGAVCNEIVEEWKDASSHFTFEDATLDEAINGVENLDYFDSLVIGTSEGYPYVLERERNQKGKSRYLEGEVGSLKIQPNSKVAKDVSSLYEECANQVPELVGIECPKDEKVKRAKVFGKPKTRLFTVLPMSYNLVVRMKFLRFVRFLMKRRDVLPCQVGINPYSREWDRVASTLLEKGENILCCDYSRFDGFLPKSIMARIAGMINSLCGGSQVDCSQRENLLMACVGRFAICDKVLYRVENGIPSGFPLTVILNCILNEILVRYVYRQTFKENPVVASSFRDLVSMVVYGDDNLISVHDSIKAQFNGEVIQREMAKLHITITDGVDKTLPHLAFRRLQNCDFLKRSFKMQDGLWVGPMEKESLWGQLHYVNTKNLEMKEAYLTNLESVLRELFLHSKQDCIDLRRKALNISWINLGDLPSLDKIESFFTEQRGETRPYNLVCDLMLNTALLGPLNDPGEKLSQNMLEILPNLWVSGSKTYLAEPNDYVVWLNHYGRKDNSLVLRFPSGTGRGGLPTKVWLEENYLRKSSNVYKLLKEAYTSHRRIVFISPNDNVVGLVFLTLFAARCGAIRREDSNVLLTIAMNQTKSLGYLPGEMGDYF
uniref:RNA1 polyprotein n=1 Tax=Prunus virus F TaxID=1855510 RepID=A0A2R2Z1Z9_9SECO|nr:polyprotein 1 [Prunus virus F]